MLVTWSKDHVWEPLTLCQHFAYCCVGTSSIGGDMYFICHVTQQDLSVEMTCVFMGDSSSPYIATLKSLVTIGILIVMRKNASSKTSYNYVRHWKIELIGQSPGEKKMSQTQVIYFEKKCPEIKKKSFFRLWLPSITLLLKWKPVELKRF